MKGVSNLLDVSKRRLVVHLNGGLGNQMFQIAAGKNISEKHSADLFLNLNWFKSPLFTLKGKVSRDQKRLPEVLNFPFVKKLQISGMPTPRDGRYQRYIHEGSNWSQLLFPVIEEKNFDQNFNNLTLKNRNLVGTFMSPKYFGGANLSEIFTLSETIYDAEHRSQDIGVHIRLGDYLGQNKIVIPSEKYYTHGINLISEVTGKDLDVTIFSDSPSLLLKLYPNLMRDPRVSVHIGTEGAFSEFVKLSNCAHIIASNSTFSWWACRLNSNKEKIVVRPERYFADDIANIELKDFWDTDSYSISEC